MSKHSPLDVTVTPCLDFGDRLRGFDLISISIGPTGALYVLAVTAPADYRGVRANGVGYAKITTDRVHDFAILCLDRNEPRRWRIRRQHWNFHHVQPLPDNELLLVNARSRYRGADDYDENARVFGADGRLVRAFLLGDGIQHVQATADGRIWTSYFDEGIFGNFGWSDPIGKHGLALWTESGAQLYAYTPSDDLDWIADCYALNVVSDDEAWCYYYTQFPLVRICRQRVEAFWHCPLQGASGFAVWQNQVLFRGGYAHRDLYHWFELAEHGRMALRSVYRFVDKTGQPLRADMFASRGHTMFLVQGKRCYHVDVRALVDARGG